ncbi:DUF6612 family protein [Acetivibrio clariflavus]|uniref:Copper amine oxidase family protein n=1 Tax=Acetivibrio clariflavus (strain DSM 19732 / NBRC 101661 / EBR45) TaxID=720554 RepID=G8M1F1_ACECE|nr:DUF6612 family protein [Acetivibrio clariflavus]AEV69166.1 copper amine oxidase family protein [Acetivibrio clariflavus DSM 19732]
MKKFGFCLTVFLFVVLIFATVANAAQSITETPDVKIIIDGEKGTYTDVTIIADGRTLLPLREVLTKLGVPNDNEHIIWDGVKRSVTVKKDDKVIYLEVGNTVATVNGKELTIDVPPIIYSKNNRTYIPARFVAESLDKQVVWDAETRSVLISDKENYNQISDIISKSNEAMKNIKKYKFGMDMDVKVSQNAFSMEYGINVNGDVDQTNKAVHMLSVIDMLGMKIESESYLKDGYSYTKNVETGGWTKEKLSESDYEQLFESNSDIVNIKNDDIGKLAAGMVISKSDNPDEIVIKGDVLLSEFVKGFNEGLTAAGNLVDATSMNNFSMEMVFDKNTYYMKSITINLDGKIEDEIGASQYNVKIGISLSDINGDFVITVPQEII